MRKHSFHFSLHLFSLFLCIAVMAFLSGCSSEGDNLAGNCISCHTMILDDSHQMACTSCHKGDDTSKREDLAHIGLLSQPAHPDNLSNSCGGCHENEATEIEHSLHYTLNNSTNMVRKMFGAKDSLATFTDIPVSEPPENISQLTDDLLRRRCLRCHLFSPGDDYPATSHATGCGACHLKYSNGKLTSHQFTSSPADSQCLACHYGNRVGSDYYGRFEHDFHAEYRTPYTASETTVRPYGVDYHQLTPDIHQQKGLVCIDCHTKNELMKPQQSAQKITCADCHDLNRLEKSLPPGVAQGANGYDFTSKTSGVLHPLPILQHSAHFSNSSASCQACHAQWSFNDTQTHLLRSDLDEYDSWAYLTVQGSSEVEQLLEHNLDFDKDELPPVMTDKITGDIRPGVWYKGYTIRRWESPVLGRTPSGEIAVVRPLLNVAISWIDENEEIIFDGFTATTPTQGMVPYTPHTTGPAGLFYEQRLREFLETEHNRTR